MEAVLPRIRRKRIKLPPPWWWLILFVFVSVLFATMVEIAFTLKGQWWEVPWVLAGVNLSVAYWKPVSSMKLNPTELRHDVRFVAPLMFLGVLLNLGHPILTGQ